MATVTGVTKQHADGIEAQLITQVRREGTSLIFTTKGGDVLTAPGAFPLPYENYAIGEILMTDRSANPATYLGGGTWVRWGQGRVPVSVDEAQVEFDTVEKKGGSKTHRLTSRESGLRAHIHKLFGHTWGWGGGGNVWVQNAIVAAGETPAGSNNLASIQGQWDSSKEVGAEDALDPHNIMQPYITVYMWKRTA